MIRTGWRSYRGRSCAHPLSGRASAGPHCRAAAGARAALEGNTPGAGRSGEAKTARVAGEEIDDAGADDAANCSAGDRAVKVGALVCLHDAVLGARAGSVAAAPLGLSLGPQ